MKKKKIFDEAQFSVKQHFSISSIYQICKDIHCILKCLEELSSHLNLTICYTNRVLNVLTKNMF